MDQNTFEAVQAGAWVLLFVFALSFALFQYSHINSVIDAFVEANMFNDRGSSVGMELDESEIKRKADRAEVIMSILNIPDTVLQGGNEEYKVLVNNEFEFSLLDSGDIKGVTVKNINLGTDLGEYYIHGISSSSTGAYDIVSDLISDINSWSWVPDEDFEVSYDVNEIKYN